MNAITKTTSVAVLVTLSLALAARAVEPPKPKTEDVWGSVSLLPYYSHRTTWQDTMQATREAVARAGRLAPAAGKVDADPL